MNECGSRTTMKGRSLLWRFTLFIASLAVGTGAGMAGYHFTENQAWFLAVPGVLAFVWLFVANPSECCGIESSCAREKSQKR